MSRTGKETGFIKREVYRGSDKAVFQKGIWNKTQGMLLDEKMRLSISVRLVSWSRLRMVVGRHYE